MGFDEKLVKSFSYRCGGKHDKESQGEARDRPAVSVGIMEPLFTASAASVKESV